MDQNNGTIHQNIEFKTISDTETRVGSFNANGNLQGRGLIIQNENVLKDGMFRDGKLVSGTLFYHDTQEYHVGTFDEDEQLHEYGKVQDHTRKIIKDGKFNHGKLEEGMLINSGCYCFGCFDTNELLHGSCEIYSDLNKTRLVRRGIFEHGRITTGVYAHNGVFFVGNFKKTFLYGEGAVYHDQELTNLKSIGFYKHDTLEFGFDLTIPTFVNYLEGDEKQVLELLSLEILEKFQILLIANPNLLDASFKIYSLLDLLIKKLGLSSTIINHSKIQSRLQKYLQRIYQIYNVLNNVTKCIDRYDVNLNIMVGSYLHPEFTFTFIKQCQEVQLQKLQKEIQKKSQLIRAIKNRDKFNQLSKRRRTEKQKMWRKKNSSQ